METKDVNNTVMGDSASDPNEHKQPTENNHEVKNKKESAESAEQVNEQSITEEEVSELDQLNAEMDLLRKELDAKNDQFLRKVAEFENFRKRTERDRLQLFATAKAEAVKDFLPVNDDLKRTLDVADNVQVDDKFLEGVKMVADKFEAVLTKYGIERIDEVMVPFDVNIHEALMRQPAPSKDVESNTVLQVLEPGYKIDERVIRHAKVIVSE